MEDEQHNHTEHDFSLTGGKLCLDFANTAEYRAPASKPEVDHFTRYDALVAWGQQAGVLEEGQARQLLALAEAQPQKAEQVLARAIVLREAIYRVFSDIAGGDAPDADDLGDINAALAPGLAQARLALEGEQVVWSWAEAPALDRVLWPVARSAADLLTCEERERVRECAGDNCSWLFMDTSRNRSRQWCDMQSCGNRAKAKRHYHKHRANSESL
ncbi:MAG TPA: ABATE domain-containing protein [Ktedonobacterales bacterium]|jgi:predicted RNA-binding Zn ribbon-like protein